MKFAKELEADLVPEWRAKYLDYKTGKKKLKAITRALRNVERTPNSDGAPFPPSSTFRHAPFYTFLNRSGPQDTNGRRASSVAAQSSRQWASTADDDDDNDNDDQEARNVHPPSHSVPIPGTDTHAETTPLHTGQRPGDRQGITRYGSIIASPPISGSVSSRRDAPSLRLPGPAIGHHDGDDTSLEPVHKPMRTASHQSESNGNGNGDPSINNNAYQVGPVTPPPRHPTSLAPRYRSLFKPKRVNSLPATEETTPARPATKRTFTWRANTTTKASAQGDIVLNAYREVDTCQADFLIFLDKELDKIEDFYKQKEDEATQRFKLLREQLHIMRDQRVEDLIDTGKSGRPGVTSSNNKNQNGDDARGIMQKSWRVDQIYGRAKRTRGTKTAQAMKMLGTPSGPRPIDAMQDYVRRRRPQEVPYRTAKHKLKIALAEYYRGLELLKSYALLNRTAFRKMTKKFDKTINARPSGRYMSEKVNKAYFVNSAIVEDHIQAVEDLYARYFERGNHKIAVGKLRAKGVRAGDFTGNVFRNGLMIGIGAVFGVQGVVYAGELLYHDDPVLALHTSYLMQIYGGYAMMLLLTLLFCLACRVWQRAKVNYAFIFEFDTRHHLDWRQLSEIPCFLAFCLGLTMWLNFSRFVTDDFFVYWPAILIGISAIVIFNPIPLVYHHSRFWFIRSNWRLLVAGLFPVEFRDFFLGDMYCSQTYALGNIELFFCLYAQDWRNPPMCNSSHSRLLGFFTTLPGIWRALQCLRRYWDTRNVFPHLVNCGKYACTILYYVSLSLYRVDRTHPLFAFFIFAATINAVYCSVWDIVMDWSLMDPYAKHRFLRSTLAFKYTWWYYGAMVIDPILRFNWIFYAIFANDTQHSSLVSFFVAFSEVVRRGIWTLFRVENEHCTNVGRFRASRDVPLPYEVSTDNACKTDTSEPVNGDVTQVEGGEAQGSLTEQQSDRLRPTKSHTSGVDMEAGPNPLGETRRRRTAALESPVVRAFSRVGTALHSAHAQDFERRKRPELGQAVGRDIGEDDDDEDDDEDDDDATTDSEIDVSGAALVNKRRRHQDADGGYDGDAGPNGLMSPSTPGRRHVEVGVEGEEERPVLASARGSKD